MGLRGTIQNAVAQVFVGLRDIPRNVEYHRVTVTGYNPVTDQQIVSDVAHSIPAVSYKIKQESQDYKKVTVLYESRLLVQGKTFSTLGFVPAETDYIIMNSIRHEIKDIKEILESPEAAAFILTIREV